MIEMHLFVDIFFGKFFQWAGLSSSDVHPITLNAGGGRERL